MREQGWPASEGAPTVPMKITVAFSPHRAEALPFAAETMRKHEAIVLEEPANPLLVGMLEQKVPIDAYLLEMDFEFPRFARKSCQLLRELYREGKKILQIDPFMERLGEIHDFFGEGGRPEGIQEGASHHAVYREEHKWTAALLDYYQKSAGRDFDGIVSAVKAFARADASRGRLRDRMRAEKIISMARSHESVYVEAGELHIPLLGELRRRIASQDLLKPVYLMEPVVKRLGGKGRALGPGDLLTLIYAFRPNYEGRRVDLLAARNLIHVKILTKVEFEEGEDRFPHTRDQIESNRLVEGLSYTECRGLFEQIRSLTTDEAREVVREYHSPAA
jgi:hypothetical protein